MSTPTLQQLINSTPAGGTLTLQPTTYTVPVGSTVITNTITIKGTPGKTRLLFQQVNGASTGITIRAQGVSISGITHDTASPAVNPQTNKLSVIAYRAYASHFTATALTFNAIDTAIFYEASASGSTATSITANQIPRGDFIFVGGTQYVTLDTIACNGSVNEHCVRIDVNPLTGQNTAGNITIKNSRFAQIGVKETIAGRTFIGPVLITNTNFLAWTRYGQVGNPPPALSAGKLTIQSCQFHQGAYLQLDQGVMGATISDNAFDAMSSYEPIHGNGPNLQATGNGNTMVKIPGQTWGGNYYNLVQMSPTDYCNPQFLAPAV